jgi:hypothetical protein
LRRTEFLRLVLRGFLERGRYMGRGP